MTEWRPIEGYEGVYWVSSDGRIGKKIGPGDPRPLSTRPNSAGYWKCQVRWGGKRKVIALHREMARAFIPNPEGYPLVRHLDDVKSNNTLENLAWGTTRHNAQDRGKNGGGAFEQRAAVATHCTKGLHERTPDNLVTRRKPDGRTSRTCGPCEKERGRVARERSRERRAAKERERRAGWSPEQWEANRAYMRARRARQRDN